MSRAASDCLIRALATYLGPFASVDAETSAWWSATFSGTRHIVRCTVETSLSFEKAITNLAEAPLPMPGRFVADIALVKRSDTGTHAQLAIHALTIDEA